MSNSTIVLIVLASLFIYVVYIYNSLVSLRAMYKNFFAQIEVQLKRRYDLIPNLVETAKKYMSHEEETLVKVTEARNQAIQSLQNTKDDLSTANISKLIQSENNLNNALGGLNFVMESYPDLKANEIIQNLQEELTSTENKVSFARQAYNDTVMRYNIFRQSFPNNIIAGIFGHQNDVKSLEFEDSDKIQNSVKVSF